MKSYSRYRFGDMLLLYYVDGEQRVSMTLVPAAMEGQIRDKEYRPEPLVQIHALGTRCRTDTETDIRWPVQRPRTR